MSAMILSMILSATSDLGITGSTSVTPVRAIMMTRLVSEPKTCPALTSLATIRSRDLRASFSRAFASQAAAYVICAGGINRKADYPEEYRDLVPFEHDGSSCIIDPRGEIIAGPVKGEETILTAMGSLELVRSVKAVIDIGGHYSRPDIFRFEVLR